MKINKKNVQTYNNFSNIMITFNDNERVVFELINPKLDVFNFIHEVKTKTDSSPILKVNLEVSQLEIKLTGLVVHTIIPPTFWKEFFYRLLFWRRINK